MSQTSNIIIGEFGLDFNFPDKHRSAVRLKAGPSACKEWQRAADIAGSRAVVKFTVPGPMTLMDGMVIIFVIDSRNHFTKSR